MLKVNGNQPKTYEDLLYGIIRCYLPLGTSESVPPLPQSSRVVLDLYTLEGWKALVVNWMVCHCADPC